MEEAVLHMEGSVDKLMRELEGQTMDFKGLHGFASRCGLTIWERGGWALVVLTELPDNPGTSVTNAFEMIATEVYQRHLPAYDPARITWVEHYIKEKPEADTFDRVFIDWDGQKFYSPDWRPLQYKTQENLLEMFLPPFDRRPTK